MVDAVIFVGPSLPVEIAQRHLPALYCGPAAQGDVLRILAQRPRLIGIIDGYFETVPSVWHKEILCAMHNGVHVLGAASMGALRAAELEAFGMVGVGQVFEWYRTGLLEDDDEVAVAHGPADTGYRAASEAMVNIRAAVMAVRDATLITDTVASRIIDVAKSLHYSDRNYRTIVELLEDELEPAVADRLRAHLMSLRPTLKERDAVLLLQRAAAFLALNPQPMQPTFSLETTVFLDAMIHEAERCAAEEEAAASLLQSAVGSEGTLVRHEILMRLLARREATRLGFDCSAEEEADARNEFAAANGFDSEVHLLNGLQACGIHEQEFAGMMRDAVLLEKLDRYYGSDISAATAAHIRIRTFRRTRAR